MKKQVEKKIKQKDKKITINEVAVMVENLAVATAKGFEQINTRMDTLEVGLSELHSDTNHNFAKVHQEIFTMKVTMSIE